jgi:hypothetical protein
LLLPDIRWLKSLIQSSLSLITAFPREIHARQFYTSLNGEIIMSTFGKAAEVGSILQTSSISITNMRRWHFPLESLKFEDAQCCCKEACEGLPRAVKLRPAGKVHVDGPEK